MMLLLCAFSLSVVLDVWLRVDLPLRVFLLVRDSNFEYLVVEDYSSSLKHLGLSSLFPSISSRMRKFAPLWFSP